MSLYLLHHFHPAQPHYRLTRAPPGPAAPRSIWDQGDSHWDNRQSLWDQEQRAAPELPVSVADAVAHLRLAPGSENGPEAPMIERMIRAATNHLERYCSHAVMLQYWMMHLLWLPPAIRMPLPPLRAIISIKIGNDVIDPDAYVIDFDDRLSSIVYSAHAVWPTFHASTIHFACGYETADDVPEAIKQALLLAVAAWFENRESLQQFQLTPMIEIGWESLLAPYREAGFA